MANGATVDILTLTNLYRLRIFRSAGKRKNGPTGLSLHEGNRRTGTVIDKRPADVGPPSYGAAPSYGATASYKVRIETETLVNDGPALAAIFHQLGFEPVFRYEKFRTEWS